MTAARDVVLARVRAALGPSPEVPDVPRAYHRGARGPGTGLVDLFCERVADYRATVHRTGDVTAAVRAACDAHGAHRLACAPGSVLVDGLELVPDDPPLPVAELDGLDGVVTGCALAIAQTGTIVLDGAAASGRRALTLVPDLHVCVVRAEQVVADVPEAIAALAPAARAGRPITLVSGPSATSDIELQRVEGVHGPRRLDVVVAAS